MTINLDEIPKDRVFIFVSLCKGAIDLKKIGKDQDFYLNLCAEIWKLIDSENLDKMDLSIKEYLHNQINKNIDLIKKSFTKKEM